MGGVKRFARVLPPSGGNKSLSLSLSLSSFFVLVGLGSFAFASVCLILLALACVCLPPFAPFLDRSAESSSSLSSIVRNTGTDPGYIYVIFEDVKTSDWAGAGQLFGKAPEAG